MVCTSAVSSWGDWFRRFGWKHLWCRLAVYMWFGGSPSGSCLISHFAALKSWCCVSLRTPFACDLAPYHSFNAEEKYSVVRRIEDSQEPRKYMQLWHVTVMKWNDRVMCKWWVIISRADLRLQDQDGYCSNPSSSAFSCWQTTLKLQVTSSVFEDVWSNLIIVDVICTSGSPRQASAPNTPDPQARRPWESTRKALSGEKEDLTTIHHIKINWKSLAIQVAPFCGRRLI